MKGALVLGISWIFAENDQAKKFANELVIIPPPRQTFDSYITTDWPGVTAHCA